MRSSDSPSFESQSVASAAAADCNIKTMSLTNKNIIFLLKSTILFIIIIFIASSSAHRRDHRFQPHYSRHPSPAYIRLLTTYDTSNPNGTANTEKYFGQRVERLDSSGKGQSRIRTVGVVLNNGLSMPLVGFGTWQLAGNHSVKRLTIKRALEAGYRLLDTAYLYHTEAAIGEALAEAFTSRIPNLTREDIFVTTKVWPTFFSRERVVQSIADSLAKLRLAYVDLVLLHFPTGFREGADDWPVFKQNSSVIPHSWTENGFLESWQALEEAVKRNLTRSIGVSNFNRRQMKVLLSRATIKPVLNQVESHPYFANEKLRRFLAENKVLMQAYAPLRRGDTRGLLADGKMREIGARYGKTAAQVALRWQLDRSSPPVPLVVKSSNRARMAANLELFDFSLDREEVAALGALPQQPRIYTLPGAEAHPDYPFSEE